MKNTLVVEGCGRRKDRQAIQKEGWAVDRRREDEQRMWVRPRIEGGR
jgi:hypothetical protein